MVHLERTMPYDLDTIADLQKIPVMLYEIGILNQNVKNIMSGNFIRFSQKNLPGS